MEEDIGVCNESTHITNHNLFRDVDLKSYLDGKDIIFDINYGEHNENCNHVNSYFENIQLLDHLGIDSDEEEKDESGSNQFENMAKKMIDLTGDGGVLKKVIKEGIGEYPSENALIRFHYDAFTEYADEPFDSSYLRGKSYRARLGKDGLLLGVELALKQMKKFEKAEFLFKPIYGFGQIGCPPRIPPASTLWYRIEILDINNNSILAKLEGLSAEEYKEIEFQTFIDVATSELEQGNEYYQKSNYISALLRYQHAVQIMDKAHIVDQTDEKSQEAILLKLYLNIAQCNLKLGEASKTITFCRKALNLNPQNIKAKFRLASAFIMLNNDLKNAKNLLKEVQKSAPDDSDVVKALELLEKKEKQNLCLETNLCKKMFQSQSNKIQKGDDCTEVVRIKVSKEYRDLIKGKLDDFILSSSKVLNLSAKDEEMEYLRNEVKLRGLIMQRQNVDSYSFIISKK